MRNDNDGDKTLTYTNSQGRETTITIFTDDDGEKQFERIDALKQSDKFITHIAKLLTEENEDEAIDAKIEIGELTVDLEFRKIMLQRGKMSPSDIKQLIQIATEIKQLSETKKKNFSKKKDNFLESFKEQRLLILDLESHFYAYYAHVLSKIEAHFNAKGKNTEELYQVLKEFTAKNSFFCTKIDKEVQRCIGSHGVLNNEGKIDVDKLNLRLRQSIPNLKKEFDRLLKSQLNDDTLTDTPFREDINVAPNNFTMTNDAGLVFTALSSTISIGAGKIKNLAVTNVTLKQNDKELFTAIRTSHLVSTSTQLKYRRYLIATALVGIIGLAIVCVFPPLAIPILAAVMPILIKIGVVLAAIVGASISTTASAVIGATVIGGGTIGIAKAMDAWLFSKKENTTDIIKALTNKNKPTIYHLISPRYAEIKIPQSITDSFSLFKKLRIAITDSLTNMEAHRLRILIKAQQKYNKEVLNDKNYITPEQIELTNLFFTLNTPTNTLSNDVAQSHTIALAILLFGHDHEHVKKMAWHSIHDQGTDKGLNESREILVDLAKKTLKNLVRLTLSSHQQIAHQFLLKRFVDDSVATIQWAKESATYIGVLSQNAVNLIITEDSNNEICRSGILDQTENFLFCPIEQKEPLVTLLSVKEPKF